MALNVFIRQPFTNSDVQEQKLVQDVMDLVKQQQQGFDLNFLVPLAAQNAATFKQYFTQTQKQAFTPKNFRQYRLGLLDQADAFINIRAGMSESGAFELAYHIFKGRNTPIFFAIWEQAAIKTTLLKELDDLTQVTYVTFTQVEELRQPLQQFLTTCNQYKTKEPYEENDLCPST